MRWIYSNPSDQQEAEVRSQTLQMIEKWWSEFEGNHNRIDELFRGKIQWDLASWMRYFLESIAPGLMWEFGPAIHQSGHRLVITPEGNHHLRPLAADIVARAPKIDGWEFYEWRLPEDSEMVATHVEARTECDFSDVSIAVSAGEENRIDVFYCWPDLPEDDHQALHAAVVATETLLGEELLDKWVGNIEPLSSEDAVASGKRFLPLERAFETFAAVRTSVLDQLPAVPWAADDEKDQWALMSREATPAEDYASRDDLMTCVTCNPDLISASFSGRAFASERFGRSGTVFAFVKVDGSESGEMIYADRDEMEAAIRVALEQAKVGGLVGGGHGLRYSYVEFGATDFPKAVEVIRATLRQGKVPLRSWILFHDASMSAEWIGIYNDSPPPLMPGPDDDIEDDMDGEGEFDQE